MDFSGTTQCIMHLSLQFQAQHGYEYKTFNSLHFHQQGQFLPDKGRRIWNYNEKNCLVFSEFRNRIQAVFMRQNNLGTSSLLVLCSVCKTELVGGAACSSFIQAICILHLLTLLLPFLSDQLGDTKTIRPFALKGHGAIAHSPVWLHLMGH